MDRNRTLVLRIAGSVVGLLVVGVAVGVALFFILIPFDPDKGGSMEGFFPFIFGALGGVLAGTVGAALGATITQKLSGQRSSFWRALLGAVVGWLVGVLCGLVLFGPITGLVTTVAGAVIGSGWKAQPIDTEGSEGNPGLGFTRRGNDTHCNKCGTELIGPRGPCRKCDDVQTTPCASCGCYILPNDKTCLYCGADVQ